jgi:hypothetical protein
MEEDWYAGRAALRVLLHEHPRWPAARLARELGRSVSWVRKWRGRLESMKSCGDRRRRPRPGAAPAAPPANAPLWRMIAG